MCHNLRCLIFSENRELKGTAEDLQMIERVPAKRYELLWRPREYAQASEDYQELSFVLLCTCRGSQRGSSSTSASSASTETALWIKEIETTSRSLPFLRNKIPLIPARGPRLIVTRRPTVRGRMRLDS